MDLQTTIKEVLDQLPTLQSSADWESREQELAEAIHLLSSLKTEAKNKRLSLGQSEHGSLSDHLQRLVDKEYDFSLPTQEAIDLLSIKYYSGRQDLTFQAVSSVYDLLTVRIILDTPTDRVVRTEVIIKSSLTPFSQGYAKSQCILKDSLDAIALNQKVEELLSKAISKSAQVFADTLKQKNFVSP